MLARTAVSSSTTAIIGGLDKRNTFDCRLNAMRNIAHHNSAHVTDPAAAREVYRCMTATDGQFLTTPTTLNVGHGLLKTPVQRQPSRQHARHVRSPSLSGCAAMRLYERHLTDLGMSGVNMR